MAGGEPPRVSPGRSFHFSGKTGDGPRCKGEQHSVPEGDECWAETTPPGPGAGLGNVRAEGRSERILRKQRLSEDLGVSVENQGPTGQARADTGAGPVPVAGQSAGGGRARDEFGGSLTGSLVTSLLGLGLDQRGRTTSGSGAHTSIRTS